MTEPAAILDCAMDPATNDAGARSVREYLSALLAQVWERDEEFSGKRPFGNSGWKWEIRTALVKGGLVEGRLDADGYLDECDTRAADELVQNAIVALGESP
jgi:hypothetical protein